MNFVPVGSLREVLIYPTTVHDWETSGGTDAELLEVMTLAHLDGFKCNNVHPTLDETQDWDAALKRFSVERKPDTDAIADLALDNFVEMRDSVSHPDFQIKRAIEMKLESAYAKAEYSSKYSLVTFPPKGMGYREAMMKGRAQDKAILWLINNNEIQLEDSAESLLAAIDKKTAEVIWHRN